MQLGNSSMTESVMLQISLWIHYLETYMFLKEKKRWMKYMFKDIKKCGCKINWHSIVNPIILI